MDDKLIAQPQPGIVPAATSIEALIARAIDKGVPVETMERLLVMRTQLKAEAAKEAYFLALAALQAELPIIPKSKPVDYGNGKAKYSYAPFDEIIKIVQPYLFKHGFSVTLGERHDDTKAFAVATAHHIDGHSESSDFPIVVDASARMNAAQQQASARTYAKRYAYCNVLGIVTGDEDDNAQTSSVRPDTPVRMVPVTPTVVRTINPDERKRLWTVASKAGHSNEEVKTWLLGVYRYKSSNDIRIDQFNDICNRLADRAPLNEPEPPPPDMGDANEDIQY